MTRMKLWSLAAGVALTVAGCSNKQAVVKEIAVAEAAQLHKAGQMVPVDANTDDFRKDNGIVPGAILLASSSRYDVSVLPPEKTKKLVFYCTSRL
jgi:hypothetical protein